MIIILYILFANCQGFSEKNLYFEENFLFVPIYTVDARRNGSSLVRERRTKSNRTKSNGDEQNMLGKVFGLMCGIAFVFSFTNGSTGALCTAITDGASSAVTLTLSLIGSMCLWCGIMSVLKKSGAVSFLTKPLMPIIKFFFPSAGSGKGREEISASMAANLLGMGNAATPLALAAMKKLCETHTEGGGSRAIPSSDMISLAVLNTAAANLLPTTIVALRTAAGSDDPFSVVLPIWIVSFSCALFSLILTKALGACDKKSGRKKQ